VALIRDLVLQLAVWLAAGAATTVPIDTLAQSSPDQEYQLKAVFLFNFAQFVEWPASAFPSPETPLVIGVLGEDPFGPYLDETVRGEKVNDRPLRRGDHRPGNAVRGREAGRRGREAGIGDHTGDHAHRMGPTHGRPGGRARVRRPRPQQAAQAA
jgi:hypothetical protein